MKNDLDYLIIFYHFIFVTDSEVWLNAVELMLASGLCYSLQRGLWYKGQLTKEYATTARLGPSALGF